MQQKLKCINLRFFSAEMFTFHLLQKVDDRIVDNIISLSQYFICNRKGKVRFAKTCISIEQKARKTFVHTPDKHAGWIP